jgi:hypothetical protein
MRYEATVHFEVKDDDLRLTELMTDLIRDQKVQIDGLDLSCRTDEGELASQVSMGWGGEVGWSPEAEARIARATEDISQRLEVDETTANRLVASGVA